MCKGWSERDVTWVNNYSPFKTILLIFKRDTCFNINASQASKDQSRVWFEFIIRGLTDVIDLNPANWDPCALGSLRLRTEERLTTTLSNQSLIPRLLRRWLKLRMMTSQISPQPTMSEASMFLQRVRDLALSMKDQTLRESINTSREPLLRAKVTE